MNIVRYTSELEHLAKNFKCGNDVIDKFLHDGNEKYAFRNYAACSK